MTPHGHADEVAAEWRATEVLKSSAPQRPLSTKPPLTKETDRSSIPLEASVRGHLEPRFGADFSNVRVHSDGFAAAQARALGADAYARGSHIWFGLGRYQPASEGGRRLIAHELVHVIQAAETEDDAAARRIRLFGTGEHVQFGEINGKQTETTINGLKVLYGELIALGDFFATPEDMYREPVAKLSALLQAIRRDAAKPGSVDSSEWDQLTSGRYFTLARKNDAHFSAPNARILPTTFSGTTNNRASYSQYHCEALFSAMKGDLEKAFAINAFADHFLTDAFAAGHLINKSDVATAFTVSLSKGKDAFFTDVAGQVWDDMEVRSIFSPYTFTTVPRLFMGSDGVDTAATLAKLLKWIHLVMPDLLPNSAVKGLHDRLNEQGVNVTNAAGTWRTVGDDNLKSSDKTRDMVRLAVAASQAELRAAAASGSAPNPPYDNVWKFVPSPTITGPDSGQTQVAREAADYTDAANPVTRTTIANLTRKNIQSLTRKLQEKGILEQTRAGFPVTTPEDWAYPPIGGPL